MVKVRGPMMSLDAAGTLADAITFSKWKGRSYVRERVKPTDPNSGAQRGRRALFSFLSPEWNAFSGGAKATWEPIAEELAASPFNAYVSANMQYWHEFLAPTQSHPPTRTGTIGTWSVGPLATWVEHRILISGQLLAVNHNWAVILFASPTAAFNTAVANCIHCLALTTTAVFQYYWSPPAVQTWYFDTRLVTFNGTLGAEQGEFNAAP